MNWLLPKELPIEITDHVLCLSFEWDWYNFFTKPSIGIQYFVVHCFRRAQLLPLSWVELHAIERQTVISATSVIFMQPPNHLSSEPLCSCHKTEIILHASPLQSNGGRTQKIWFKFLAKCYNNIVRQSSQTLGVGSLIKNICGVHSSPPSNVTIRTSLVLEGLVAYIWKSQKSSQPCPCCLLTGFQLFHHVIVFPCSRLKLETNFLIPNAEQGYITVASTPGRFVWRLKYNNWSLKFENWNIVLNSGYCCQRSCIA